MTNNRRANRNLRNARRQGESDAFNRLAAILERLTNPHLATSITNNYISVGTLTTLNQSETPSEPRTKEPKRKKRKSTQNYAITTPTPPANSNYTTQQQPRQTPTQANTPQRTQRKYTGPHPLCLNCNFHHPTHTPCRLCTSCNRLGHFATNCRTNPTSNSSVAPTPYIPNTQTIRICYYCGDPTHLKNACPNLSINPAPQPDHNRIFALTTAQDQDRPPNQLTATTVSTLQQDQAPEFYDSVMNS